MIRNDYINKKVQEAVEEELYKQSEQYQIDKLNEKIKKKKLQKIKIKYILFNTSSFLCILTFLFAIGCLIIGNLIFSLINFTICFVLAILLILKGNYL